MEETAWPPQSAHDALLSSPSGRRKNRSLQESRLLSSVSPVVNLSYTNGDEEIEDEETIQLRLEAIEARLKLKKLQQQKARAVVADPPTHGRNAAHDTTGKFRAKVADHAPYKANSTVRVDVPTSPMRKQGQLPNLPGSPGRILLGIDKGRSGKDVSLQSLPKPHRPYSLDSLRSASISTQSDKASVNCLKSTPDPKTGKRKSFNERMASKRQSENETLQERDRSKRLRKQRSRGFGMKPSDVDAYKIQSTKPVKDYNTTNDRSENFSREQVLIAANAQTKSERSKSERSIESSENLSGKRQSLKLQTENKFFESGLHSTGKSRPDSSLFEEISATPLSERIIPQEALVRVLRGKKVIDITSMLRDLKEPDWQIPEDVLADHEDFVVFGIVGQKSQPLDHKEKSKDVSGSSISTKASHSEAEETWLNDQKKYMIMTIVAPNLRWSVDMYLFTTAYSRWRMLNRGTLIAILNPGIMPPPPGRMNTNRWSLKLDSSEDTVLEVGSSRDIGWCKAVKRNGEACSQWIDAKRLQYCEWHLSQGIAKAKSTRMEIQGSGLSNRQDNGPGQYRKLGSFKGVCKGEENRRGRKFDNCSQSHYFVTPGGFDDRSVSRLIDSEDMAKNRGLNGEEMRRRFAEQEKEMQMAIQLGANGSGAGAEYMKLRHLQDGKESSTGLADQSTSLKARKNAQRLGLSGRNEAEISLSPLKKKPRGGFSDHEIPRMLNLNGTKDMRNPHISSIRGGVIDEGDDLEIV